VGKVTKHVSDEARRGSTEVAETVELIAIGDKPNQPRLKSFPKQSFGVKTVSNQSFQAAWFDKWKWIHYDQVNDRAFCYTCVLAMKQGKMKRFNASPSKVTFISTGYCNWKDASGDKHGRFKLHEKSKVGK